MTDSWNDNTVPRQPAPPQYAAQHPVGPPPGPAGPPVDATPPKGLDHGPVDETPWVRSIYLFGACATGGVLMIFGLLLAVGSLVVAITPDSGLRDGWDRGLVGATEVADEGIAVFDEFGREQLRDEFDRFCDDAGDDSFCDDLADRIDDDESVVPDEVTDGIALIRDEVHRQIRAAAIAKTVAGSVLVIVGLLLFRFHSKQVTVYRKA